jgi:hypothetical protein
VELAGFTHHTFSPALLVLLSVVSALIVAGVARRRRRGALLIAVASSLMLVWIAGEHLPFISSIAPQSLCFGAPGAAHWVAFALPLLALVLARPRRISPVV